VERQRELGDLGLPLVAIGLLVLAGQTGNWLHARAARQALPVMSAAAPPPAPIAAPAMSPPTAATTPPKSLTAAAAKPPVRPSTARAAQATSTSGRVAAKRLKANVVAGPGRGRTIFLNREDRVTVLRRVGDSYLVQDRSGHQVYVRAAQIVTSP
jgi:hypothetical protein